MTEHNLPVPDDAPWLNLSPQEIVELRKSKRQLTEYATQKLHKLKMNNIAQKCVSAARNVAEGSPTLGKLIREGKDPMITKTYYEYAAVLREVVEQCRVGGLMYYCSDILELADELEAL